MTTYTCPDVKPSYGSRGETNFAILEARFGDGYSQRTTDGLNNRRETWDLTWENIEQTDKAALQSFLDARQGYEAFYWTPPGGSQKKWTCKQYGDRPSGGSITVFSAKFIQEFDL